jgi:glutamine amidotransferase
MTVAIVKYNAGNTFSVQTALARLGVACVITDEPSLLRTAKRVIVPGVGAANSAMPFLIERGLDRVITSLSQPVLGICLGFQLMCLRSEEGDAECLGILPTTVRKLRMAPKVPHVGWSTLECVEHPIFAGLGESPYVYFVHSYRADCSPHTIARCRYGEEFAAAAGLGNFVGVQFHPEKSGAVGARILKNFLEWEP